MQSLLLTTLATCQYSTTWRHRVPDALYALGSTRVISDAVSEVTNVFDCGAVDISFFGLLEAMFTFCMKLI